DFQFTGNTPAWYYAQAAWEFQHNNPEKAADWTASANKIYSSALNGVFTDAFYDVGWVQRPPAETMPTPAFDTAQAEGSPAGEPSPIPDKVFAANSQSDTSKGEGLALSSTVTAPSAGLDIASAGSTTGQTSISSSKDSASGTGAQPEQQPASVPSSGGSDSVAAVAPAESPQTSPAPNEQSNQPAVVQTGASASPAVEAVPGKSAPSGILARTRMWVVGGLLLAGLVILAWVTVPTLRRRYAFNVPSYSRTISAAAPALFKPRASVTPQKKPLQSNGFVGGPRQVSLQLKAAKPSSRHTAIPSGNL